MKRKAAHSQKTKMEFSKKILLAAGVVNIAVIIFACVMMWRTFDTSPLAYLIPAVAAEVATGTGYYYWKAKAENQIKLKKIYGDIKEDDADDTSPVG
ncbi:MAG: hypothetical protein ACI3VY_04500 [Faecousia sp.]